MKGLTIKNIIKHLGFLFFINPLYAQQMDVEIKSLYIKSERHVLTNRSYYIPDTEKSTYSLDMGLDIDITKNIYLNQKVTSEVGSAQFRHIGYEPEIGYKTKFGIDFYIRHFSGHALDFTYQRRFPEENVMGVRFNLIRK